MKANASHEQHFNAEVDAFDFLKRDLQTTLRRLDAWLAHVNADLETHRLVCTGLNASSPLRQQAEAINAVLQRAASAWARQWTSLAPARALADAFDDQAILLVFGKFNAGKSSLCNFLADRFATHGTAVCYFHFEAGRIVEPSERFKEGTTETTARLQGVRLGDKLVLLDTPGLHSATRENAALTQRFTDSADGVLWLTSSAAPGQVQELDELIRELKRAKPLLPIVTRSDLFEEDEIDGELVKRLRNKTAQNRAQQEADVTARAAEKLAAMGVDVTQLKPPVSISVYMAREQGQTPAAMEEAGFERLYAALLAIAEPALAYKRQKPAEILLHHLEENVLGMLHDQTLPTLTALKAAAQSALDRLERQQEHVINAVWRGVVPVLPELLDKHSAASDVKAICSHLSQVLFTAFVHAEEEYLADFALIPDSSLARIDRDGDGFQDLATAVDDAHRYVELQKQIRVKLLQLTDVAIAECRVSITRLTESAMRMQDILRAHESRLIELKTELRMRAI